ncbi:Spermidine/putrescine import ATP-binding protein PotA [Rubrobacter xylanophilus DSM 9941]|uniref:ABC transporter ATP-binding protein n=1 Tax=Rubrobacter xylanophilus TaxID=49319 RepID=UPI001C644050|nr:ABC transporter ATP-binding protein [Rubrobacter xylanophilus]QYJ15949.1 Spermidine/putrescine import ATP-binding protein PotA [Rubrobacter xylanophilus DSM 9941]
MERQNTAERGRGAREGERPVAVRLQNVTKRFGEFAAVEGLSLEIHEGEFFSLLGPSGCGKTTTLRMIAGFEEPTSGEVMVGGRSMRGVPPYRRPVNTVFQSYALFPHLDVFENVAFGLRRAGIPKDEISRRVGEACALVKLSGFERRKPSRLSGGQQQRVALARALVNRPKVLLLDEPLGALDLKLRKEMQLELKNLQHEVGITFIYVTHDQEEALTMSDRIAVMNEGRVQQVADPTTLYELPANRFVADFIGQTNILEGVVESVEGRRATLRTPGGLRLEAVLTNGFRPAVGESVEAAVRPEKLRMGEAGDNVVSAEVSEVVYLGSSTQYILESPEGGRLVVHRQNDREAAPLRSGEAVSVAWDARHCLILGGRRG